MATVQSTEFRKFERSDGITSKIISSFQERDLLVIAPEREDFELSISLQRVYTVQKIQLKKLN